MLNKSFKEDTTWKKYFNQKISILQY